MAHKEEATRIRQELDEEMESLGMKPSAPSSSAIGMMVCLGMAGLFAAYGDWEHVRYFILGIAILAAHSRIDKMVAK